MKMKLKTHRGAAKRFKKTATGKFKRGQSFKRHILTSKTTKRKRGLRITLDRKSLAELAARDPETFSVLVQKAKAASAA